ncbi:MAG TPA: acetate--CoA ligase family protein [Beijerinckiaceae bacterium]|nr:acetate--CoA ligase family protein [Beijerinckiaceae bacterium]
MMLERRRALPIEALLRPRSIALVGVSAKGGSGAKILNSTRRSGFAGPVWPVNPGYAEIGGLPCFRSLGDLPEVPDCVVVSVPAGAVQDVVEEAAKRGVRGALVVSEGFADAATDEGKERQRRLVTLAERANMALAGPNCMGIASLQNCYAATMADIPEQVIAGGISLVSQSGGLLNAVAELSSNRGIGLNYLVSIGNQAVLDLADYIDFLAHDPTTAVITCIMEGAKDGRRFRAAIEAAARVKPVIVLKLGRSESGQAATLAHTGTLAGRHEAYAALFKQNGVALVDSIDELVETAALMERAPLPKGDRVCMLTVSGGATSLIGDLGEKAGVKFPPIEAETNRRLEVILGVERRFGNPLDTVGMPRLRKERNMTAVLTALNEADNIDVIGLVLGMRQDGAASHEEVIEQLAAAAKSATKPLLVVSFISNSLTGRWRDYARQSGLPLVEDLERGLKAVRHLIDYAACRRKAPARSGDAQSAPTSPVLAGAHAAGVTLTEAESKRILAEAGLPVTREELARTPDDAVRLAAGIGGRVALKIQSRDIPHKSDVGGVFLGASGADDVARAARQVLDNAAHACPKAVIDGVLVQEMVEDGTEFILGMTYDDQFGPLVVCGAGGVMVELLKDAAVLIPPVTSDDVREMLRGLKASRLLDGFRGAAPRDVEALVDCCVRFARFVAATEGQFAAIDLNPVLVCPRGRGVRIADALIVTQQNREEIRHAAP